MPLKVASKVGHKYLYTYSATGDKLRVVTVTNEDAQFGGIFEVMPPCNTEQIVTVAKRSSAKGGYIIRMINKVHKLIVNLKNIAT